MFVTEEQINSITTKIDLLAEEVITLRQIITRPPEKKEVYSIKEFKDKLKIGSQGQWNTERFWLIQAGMTRIGHNYRMTDEQWERYFFNKRKNQRS